MDVKSKRTIEKIEIDLNPKTWFGILLMFLVLFVLPINLVHYLNNPEDLGPSIAGITTDNSGRYYTLPVINFAFDTQLRDPSTISFTLGALLLVVAVVLMLVFFVDFRGREKKYRN